MKPVIHLICNAHLDPVWLWPWSEGAAEAISTFRVAADFCENYDGFVFNHNEALLYQWVEEYETPLFARIQSLVRQGKWHIMGGWYLQPDCTMLSGESFVRQIETGRRYFEEKFGVRPRVAVNVDPFGHTRGLVQILNKTGYQGYLFMRGYPQHQDFIWEGFDGSRVKAHKLYGGYNTLKGQAADKIRAYLKEEGVPERETGLVCWGVGNHGGGASVPDMEDIVALQKSCGEATLLQSTPEAYFDTVRPEGLTVFHKSLCHWAVGCYTSMVRVKQAHRKLENRLDICYKMLAHAGLDAGEELSRAEKSLMFAQFHDAIPGSSIRRGEEDLLHQLGHGLEIADKLRTRAFFALCRGQEKGRQGEIPILVYNPHPYEVKTDVSVEFQLSDQNWAEDEFTTAHAFDGQGAPLPTQNEKPDCTFSLDWRKKAVFAANLRPMSINRFDLKLEVVKHYRPVAPCAETAEHFVVESGKMAVSISKKTGLIASLRADGREYLQNAGRILAMEDNEDPWGMTVDAFDRPAGEFQLLSAQEANRFAGYPEEDAGAVRVIENGPVRTKIQAFFGYSKSTAIVEYTISKQQPVVDVQVTLLSNDVNRMYKYSVDTLLSNAAFLGQTAFGAQELEREHREVTFQQWCGLKQDGVGVAVLNNGTYGGSSDGSAMRISLLRTPIYAAHPIEGRPIANHDRYLNHMDMGERTVSLRIVAGDVFGRADALAQQMNQPPFALSFFPQGEEAEKPGELCSLDNQAVLLTALKRRAGGETLVRLFNTTDRTQAADFRMGGARLQAQLTPFEAGTWLLRGGGFVKTNMLGEPL